VLKSISNLLNHIGLSSELIGCPQGYYETTYQWAHDYSLKKNKDINQYYKEIYPSHKIYRNKAKRLHNEMRRYPDENGFEYNMNNSFVSVIPNGRVYGSNGVIISPDDKLIGDLSREFDNVLSNHTIFKEWKLSKLKHYDASLAVISAPGGAGYYHWMFDVLPRIGLLNKAGFGNEKIDYYVVNQLAYPFHIESLNIFGVAPSKIIESNLKLHIKARYLYVPSLPGISGYVPKSSCELIRKMFLINDGNNTFTEYPNIYVGRGNVDMRVVINESEVIELVKKYGFRYVEMDGLSILEQSKIFNSSKVVIAPHGAALTNLVFCDAGTKVIEIFSPNYLLGCYWHLSSQLELDYYYISGLGEYSESTLNLDSNKDDIFVDTKTLEQLIRIVLK